MDELEMLDQRARPPRNRWTTDQRVFLCVLYRFYQEYRTAFSAIFNAIFEANARECGFTSGIPYSTLNSQWWNMHRQGYAEWSSVHIETPFERNGVWASMLQQIETTASELGFSLTKKEADNVDTSNFSLNAARLSTHDSSSAPRTGVSPSTVSAPEIQPESSDESPQGDQLTFVYTETEQAGGLEIESLTRTQTDAGADQASAADNQLELLNGSARVDQSSSVHAESQRTEPSEAESTTDDEISLGKTRICAGQPCILCHEGLHGEVLQDTPERVIPRSPSQDNQSQDVKWEFTGPEFPTLLYRWSNIDSNGLNSRHLLVAGLFASDMNIKHPSEYSKEEFKELVIRHVRTEHAPTPFISTFITPLSPIHRAFKKREGAIITIIDPSKLQTPLSWAKRLVFNLDIRIGRYCGVGEYLIWGKVPATAIVGTFKVSDLERIADNDYAIGEILQVDQIQKYDRCGDKLRRALSTGPGRFDHQSGFTVGRLLKKLAIPQSHSEGVAENIARSWKFSKAGSWDTFKGGLNAAYATSDQSSPSHPPGGRQSAGMADSVSGEYDMVDAGDLESDDEYNMVDVE